MALSPLVWVPEVQVSKRLAEDAYSPLRCPTQLAQSAESVALVQAWNGVTPTRKYMPLSIGLFPN